MSFRSAGICSTPGLGLALCASLAAQGLPQPHDLSPPSPKGAAALPGGSLPMAGLRASAGLQVVDGVLWGGAHDYKVRFAKDGVTFTPALPAAPHNVPVEFAVESFGRGNALQPVSAAELRHEGLVASYVRPEFVESWELRADAAKQSFRFDRLPGGAGDLVVRLRMATSLQVQPLGADTLVLTLPDVGGMRIEQVVGIDANGARFSGSLRHDGGVLELRLPAADVDRAALPLVLDPLVGAVFQISNVAYDDLDADVAFDATNNVFLVVFQRTFSATDYDVHGQRVNLDGTLNGGRLLIENAGGLQYGGRVANVNAADTFCVVYTLDSGTSDNIVGRAVRASDGAIGAQTVLVDTANNLGTPDVGGEATTVDDEAIVVWEDFTTGEILAKQVTVNGTTPSLAPFAATVVVGDVSTWTNSGPEISKSGGDTGNHMIVWMRQFTGVTNTSVRGAIVDRNLGVLDNLVLDSGSGDHDSPEVDGDGRNWVIAYDSEPTSGSGNTDIVAFAVGLDTTLPLGSQGVNRTGEVVVQGTSLNEFGAGVCWTGEGALVTWTRTWSGSDTDVLGRLVDLFTCADCTGSLFAFNADTDRELTIRAASMQSGGANGTRCLAAWTFEDITSPPAGTTSYVQGRLFDADDGVGVNLGGACGGGGVATFSCMRTGNSAFRLRLLEATPSAATFAMIGYRSISRSCGSCTLVVDPWTGFVALAGSTTSAGEDSYLLAIPANSSLSGFGIFAQWAVAGSGCVGFDLSNAIRATIE